MTVEEKLDAVLAKLDRLELIESHLLDLLLPQRKAFLRQPDVAPPPVLATDLKQLAIAVQSLHMKVDVLHEQRPDAETPPPEVE